MQLMIKGTNKTFKTLSNRKKWQAFFFISLLLNEISHAYNLSYNMPYFNTICIQYFSLNRILLLAIGLWPFERSKIVQFQLIVFFSILIAFILFQVCLNILFKCWCSNIIYWCYNILYNVRNVEITYLLLLNCIMLYIYARVFLYIFRKVILHLNIKIHNYI